MSISINRCVIQIRPTKKYFEWGQSHEKENFEPEEGSWGNAYLIKELDSGTREEVRKELKKYWKLIAEEEFSSWWNDDSYWPELKNIKDFEAYFDWNFTELIFDLVNSGIIREEF